MRPLYHRFNFEKTSHSSIIGEKVFQMFFLGYHSSQFALIHKEKSLLKIERLSELGDDVNPLYTQAEIVTGLETRDVVLRTLALQLKTKREVLAALPFQVESLLPFSQEELILLPTLYETEVVLMASSQSALQRHLSELAEMDIDPYIVSSVPSALFRFATHFCPDYSSLFVYHCNEDEHTFIVIREGRLAASQVQQTQDFERMCAYMQKKFPDIEAVLHTGKSNLPTPFLPIELHETYLVEYAVPIGLAFDAAKKDRQSAQFRQNSQSKKELKERKKGLTLFLAACGAFVFVSLVLGNLHLKRHENAILARLGSQKGAKLEQVVSQLTASVQSPKKSGLLISTMPKVHELLNWLSTHPALDEGCSIHRLRYEMGAVDLELKIPSARAARTFHEALLKDPMVDQKNPVHWSGDHGAYRAKFSLKSRGTK